MFKEFKRKIINWIILLDNKRIIKLRDKTYIKLYYNYRTGEKLNLKTPTTFNEKLQWLKLYNRNPIHTKMVDKYEAKKYVSRIIGKKYIIPTIGIYDKFEDIDFNKLPNQFVIKCTHDSGGIIICRNKNELDIEKARKKINDLLKTNFFYHGREWPYKNIKPRIIIENYMSNEGEENIKDYKFFCFNGKAKIFKIDFDRFIKHRANYYNINGEILPFGEELFPPDFNKKLDMPLNLEKMILLAEQISKELIFARIDFYEINRKIYFGEITFFPASGFEKFIPEEYDRYLGKMLELPKEKIIKKNEK